MNWSHVASWQLDPGILVTANIGIGDKEASIALLQQAYVQHSNVLTSMKVEPALDPIRDDPRFAELLRRIGLAE